VSVVVLMLLNRLFPSKSHINVEEHILAPVATLRVLPLKRRSRNRHSRSGFARIDKDRSWREAVSVTEARKDEVYRQRPRERMIALEGASRVSGEETPNVCGPVCDLRLAFECDRELRVETVDITAPPTSPACLSQLNVIGSGLDPSFSPFVFTEDCDFERRRSYMKRQVTDGEVMLKIMTYDVCQIFVNGIEYHYIFDGNSSSWDLPCELDWIRSWFLRIPKSRRRRFPEPPTPIVHTVGLIPVFS
jgi:hypothetical protein